VALLELKLQQACDQMEVSLAVKSNAAVIPTSHSGD